MHLKKEKCTATGKVIFNTKKNADDAMLAIKTSNRYNNKLFVNTKRTKNKVLQQRSYFCTYCGGYHLTSIKNKELQDKKDKEKSLIKKKFLLSIDPVKWKSDSAPFESGHIPAKK